MQSNVIFNISLIIYLVKVVIVVIVELDVNYNRKMIENSDRESLLKTMCAYGNHECGHCFLLGRQYGN